MCNSVPEIQPVRTVKDPKVISHKELLIKNRRCWKDWEYNYSVFYKAVIPILGWSKSRRELFI